MGCFVLGGRWGQKWQVVLLVHEDRNGTPNGGKIACDVFI